MPSRSISRHAAAASSAPAAADGSRGRRTIGGIAIAALLAALLFFALDPDLSPTGSFAYGCDDFAYQRQAELIRSRGLIRGLDTRIETPDVGPLVAIAKASSLPTADWQRILGPHCHHVDAHSGRLIAQYPPGTPLVLSPFPRGTAGYGAYLIFAVAGCLSGLLLLTLGAPSFGQVALASLFAVEACRYFFLPSSWASFSVGITAGLTALLVSLLLVAPRRRSPSVALLLVVGAIAGLLFAVRLPNVFVIAGAAVAFVGRFDLRRPAVLRARWIEVAAGLLAFLVFGPGLVAAGNWRNTGSPFHTTYGAADAAGSLLSRDLLLHHAHFYFLDSEAATLVDMSLAVVALSAVAALSPHAGRMFRWAVAAAVVTAGASLAFFMTHEITASYYLVPSALFSALVVVVTAAQAGAGPRLPVMRAGAVAGAALILAVAAYRMPSRAERDPFSFDIPPEVLAANAVVWSDFASGTLLYYNGKLATKLVFGGPCERRDLISAARKAGSPQYFIDDSPTMHDEIADLSRIATLARVGDYSAFAPLPVWKLEDAPDDLGACGPAG